MHFRYMYGNVGAQSAFAPPSIARCAQKMNHPARFRARCSGKPPHNLLYWTKSPAGPAGTGKELDERLPPLLAETMAGVDNFKLVMQDVLKVDLRALIAEEFPGMPVALCANLPYYITSPIVMKLLGDRLPIESLTVMVQKEAADRLAATPGTRASSAISCAVSYYATSKMMFTAAPGSFYPAPKVTSAVVRMDIRPTPAVQVEDEEGYFALIRAAFGQRRKTAANAIASGLSLPKENVIHAIEAAGFDARIRPEALTLEDFAAIQQALKAANA